MNVSDPVDNDVLNVNAAGRAFMTAHPPVFSTSAGTNGTVNADLVWMPTLSEESTQSYVTSFRIGETHGGVTFYRDETFQIRVNRSVGIEELEGITQQSWNLHEGLLSGNLQTSKQGSMTIELISITGQIILKHDAGLITPGRHSF
ncbi:MAG: hypothetical protein ACKO7B_19890, partial [Flavobacteriales bacterium]